MGNFRSPILVGGAITIFKNMNVNGKDGIPYMKWKIKFMFQTTNQLLNHYDPIIVLYSNTIIINYPIIVPSFIPLWKDYPSQYILILIGLPTSPSRPRLALPADTPPLAVRAAVALLVLSTIRGKGREQRGKRGGFMVIFMGFSWDFHMVISWDVEEK